MAIFGIVKLRIAKIGIAKIGIVKILAADFFVVVDGIYIE
jgi:hypothetical protein